MQETRALIEERVRVALDLPLELPEVEFKCDMPFDKLQIKIAKTAMGMANRRDGGLIIIGVSQDSTNRRFVLDGMTPTNVATYVQEAMYEFILKYASPPVEVRVVEVEHKCKTYVAVAIAPFAQTPVVCKKDAPPDAKGNMAFRAGDFIVRLPDPVQSTRVTKAEMLHDLLQLAAGRRAAELILSLREGGLDLLQIAGDAPTAEGAQTIGWAIQNENPTPSSFDAEIEDINDIL